MSVLDTIDIASTIFSRRKKLIPNSVTIPGRTHPNVAQALLIFDKVIQSLSANSMDNITKLFFSDLAIAGSRILESWNPLAEFQKISSGFEEAERILMSNRDAVRVDELLKYYESFDFESADQKVYVQNAKLIFSKKGGEWAEALEIHVDPQLLNEFLNSVQIYESGFGLASIQGLSSCDGKRVYLFKTFIEFQDSRVVEHELAHCFGRFIVGKQSSPIDTAAMLSPVKIS